MSVLPIFYMVVLRLDFCSGQNVHKMHVLLMVVSPQNDLSRLLCDAVASPETQSAEPHWQVMSRTAKLTARTVQPVVSDASAQHGQRRLHTCSATHPHLLPRSEPRSLSGARHRSCRYPICPPGTHHRSPTSSMNTCGTSLKSGNGQPQRHWTSLESCAILDL